MPHNMNACIIISPLSLSPPRHVYVFSTKSIMEFLLLLTPFINEICLKESIMKHSYKTKKLASASA